MIYITNEPIQLRAQGFAVDVIPVADYAHLAANGLITNEKTIAEEPELVRSVARAMLRGLRDTLADPDAAFAICRRYVPAIDDTSAPLQRAVLQEALGFWQSDQLGRSDPAAWEASLAFMEQIGMVESGMDASSLYSNEFVQAP